MTRVGDSQAIGQDKSVRIRRLERGDNVRAHMKNLAVDLETLGGVTLGWGQSWPHMNDAALLADLHLGQVWVPFNGRRYQLSLDGCIVRLEIVNANAIPGSYYRCVLQHLAMKSSDRNEQSRKADSAVAGDVKGEVAGGFKLVPNFLFKTVISGSASRNQVTHTEDTSNLEVVREIVLVQAISDWIFRVKDQLGEGLQQNVKGLLGPVISSAARGAPDGKGAHPTHDEDQPTPLLRLEAKNPAEPIYGVITVRADRTDFLIDDNKTREEVLKFVEDALGADRGAWLRRRTVEEAKLRRRVAALSAAEKAGSDGPAGEGVHDLFACTFCFEPDVDASSERAEE